MSFKAKSSLSGFSPMSSMTGGGNTHYSPIITGKVFGVITTENTPNKELFEKYGGFSGIGTIFYQDYSFSKNSETVDLNSCISAKPLHADTQHYPLVGELVMIIQGPSPSSQDVSNVAGQKYYLGTVNVWNNVQQNSPGTGTLGKTFIEKNDVRNLLSFEGDRIYQGRKGNGIRFGSTVPSHSDISEWSGIGDDGDPITILVNGYVTTNSSSLAPNIEEINKEKSSIYLTTSQRLPLLPDRNDILNPITKPLLPSQYNYPQIILNADRIVLNSKVDEVMLFAATNIEISTNNIINLNAARYTHINSPSINLGTNPDGTLPTEPLLLGGKTHDLLLELCGALTNLANYLAASISTEQGSPIPSLNDAGTQLFSDVISIIDGLESIQSTQNFTA
jgi:hypothetical protein